MYKWDARVEHVLADLGVPFGKPSVEWSLSVCPAPRSHSSSVKNTTWQMEGSRPTLVSIGVLFGSVLSLDCVADHCQVKAAVNA